MDNFSYLLSLRPSIVESLWFSVDKAYDEESEISQMEQEYVNELEAILKKDSDFIPIGKTASDPGPLEEIEEEEEEDNDDDDDSDSRGEDDEDDEMDVPYDPDSSPTTDNNTPRILPTEEP